jgi:tripartite-type tricarboxylate transporter receptor subunit TctC
MNLLRKSVILLAAFLSPTLGLSQESSRPIRLINQFVSGGGADVIVRPVMEAAASTLGRPVVMEFKPGASGIIAAELLESSPADGSTLIVDTQTLSNNSIFRKVPYNHDNWEPIARIGFIPLGLLVSNKLPVNDLQGLVTLAKSNPGKLTYGTVGQGTVPHLAALRFEQAMGVKLLAVPYKSSPEVHQDLLGGRIDIYFDGTTQALPLYRNRHAKLMGVSTSARLAVAPEIPTLGEQGFDLVTGGWFGISARQGTPKELISKYSEAFLAAVKRPEYVKRMDQLGVVTSGLNPEEFAVFRKEDRNRWAELVKRAGLVIE